MVPKTMSKLGSCRTFVPHVGVHLPAELGPALPQPRGIRRLVCAAEQVGDLGQRLALGGDRSGLPDVEEVHAVRGGIPELVARGGVVHWRIVERFEPRALELPHPPRRLAPLLENKPGHGHGHGSRASDLRAQISTTNMATKPFSFSFSSYYWGFTGNPKKGCYEYRREWAGVIGTAGE